MAEVCRLLNEQGIITICTFISPRAATRKQIVEIIGEDRFRLVYMSSDLESSRANRPDLYKLAEDGKLRNLAGVDAPYEIPENPDVILDLENKNIETIIELIQSK